jgi:membrane-associated phospholipid phosphatase
LVPALYSVPVAFAGDLRLEHWVFAAFAIVFGYWGPRAKRFLIDVSPIIAVGIGYDLVRYVRPFAVKPERVLGCELRAADTALFPAAGGSVQEWLAARHLPWLDLVFAVPYTIFIYLVFVYGTYLFFRDRPRMRHYLLAFAVGNYLSFACWLLLPAAPPWYVHAHGCVIDTSVAANPAGLARVDAMFGMHYFASFYGRASAVFGAMPSMHCAYPLIGLLTAWRKASASSRVVHVGYTLLMSTAAMYLDHHWAVDVIAGWLTAVLAVLLAAAWLRLRERAAVRLQPERVEVPPRKSAPRRFDRPTPVRATYPAD